MKHKRQYKFDHKPTPQELKDSIQDFVNQLNDVVAPEGGQIDQSKVLHRIIIGSKECIIELTYKE